MQPAVLLISESSLIKKKSWPSFLKSKEMKHTLRWWMNGKVFRMKSPLLLAGHWTIDFQFPHFRFRYKNRRHSSVCIFTMMCGAQNHFSSLWTITLFIKHAHFVDYLFFRKRMRLFDPGCRVPAAAQWKKRAKQSK